MAILNVSPESFYQGSVRTSRERLAEAAQAMVNAGADIIDIGAMSTAPYLKTHISVEEETARLSQAVEAVAPCVTVPISDDTPRSTSRSGPRRRSTDYQRCERPQTGSGYGCLDCQNWCWRDSHGE